MIASFFVLLCSVCMSHANLSVCSSLRSALPESRQALRQRHTQTLGRDWLQAVESWWKTAHQGDKKSDRSIVSSVSPSWWIQLPGVTRSDVEETNVKTQSKKSPGIFETQRHPRSPWSVPTPHSKQELHIDLEAPPKKEPHQRWRTQTLPHPQWQMYSKSSSPFYISFPNFLFQ